MNKRHNRDPFKMGIIAGRESERKRTAEVVAWARAVVLEYDTDGAQAATPFLRTALINLRRDNND